MRGPGQGGTPIAAEATLNIYLKEINSVDLLNAEGEKELARLVLSGDHNAREQMIRANLRLVDFAGSDLSSASIAKSRLTSATCSACSTRAKANSSRHDDSIGPCCG